MKKIIDLFKKVDGTSVLKQYAKSHLLISTFFNILQFGVSKKSLEILRLVNENKINKKLKKKYYRYLKEFDKKFICCEKKSSDIIWICWFQGIENAPIIVQKCYKSIMDNIKEKKIIIISNDNLYKYVSFPNYIIEKRRKGIISDAHFSDLLRLELLTKYGGTWIDATVWCSTYTHNFKYMLDSELFLFQTLKPGVDGHTTSISNWFITAKSNNRMLESLKYLLYQYWKDNNSIHDYFIFHQLFQIVIDFYPDDWAKVVPFDSSIPHIILLRLFDEFDNNIFSNVVTMSPFHKLTYKFDQKDTYKKNTYYKEIIEKKGNLYG